MRAVHRVAYEIAFGPIPEGMQIDHRCKNPRCVSLAHLELVTPYENVMRSNGLGALNARKTHCPKGHPYDEANTYRTPSRPNARYCRACMKENRKRHHPVAA